MTFEFEAASEEAAVKLAADRGYVVESVARMAPPPPASPAPRPPAPTSPAERRRPSAAQMIAIILMLGTIIALQLFQRNATPKWEYKIVSPSDFTLESELNSLGSSGWELLSARRALVNEEGRYEIIFRRPK